MKLQELLKDIQIIEIIGDVDVEIKSLSQDTRESFTAKTLYFAVPGTQSDGHDYISQAIEKGASLIICEKYPEIKPVDVTFVLVDSVQQKMGFMVSAFFGHPTQQMRVIAVTGTNGKTTIATILYQSLLHLGISVALFSTAGDFVNGANMDTGKKASSSLEIIAFHKQAALLVEQGVKYLCIEATSHALDQYRLNGVSLYAGIFSNLSRDHLDYHPDFDHYLNSKKRLFNMLPDGSFSVINIDDPAASSMVAETYSDIITYGNADIDNSIMRDYVFNIHDFDIMGTHVSFADTHTNIPFVGTFNMYNFLAVYIVLEKIGVEAKDIAEAFAQVSGPKGRMEMVKNTSLNIVGFVDYAHTPDALENVLTTLSEFVKARIITVIGSGGDRDRGKRPLMAGIAERYSDFVVLTSDNPRTENPHQILDDMLAGVADRDAVYVIEDREKAIARAVELANSGDVILLAGKGHEDYQIIGTAKNYFSDVEMLEKYLQKNQ